MQDLDTFVFCPYTLRAIAYPAPGRTFPGVWFGKVCVEVSVVASIVTKKRQQLKKKN